LAPTGYEPGGIAVLHVPRAAVAALVVATAIVAVGCGEESAPTTLNSTITVEGGKPKGGVQELKVKKDGQVHLTVNSDTADEVHVHGYNFMKDVEKGGSVKFDFKANIDGRFEIELENAKEQLAELSVEP
jgi:hypothetical protein